MKLHEFNQQLVLKTRTRVGRGLGSGLGKTSGRGQKVKTPVLAVAFARFEGGTNASLSSFTKRGFNNSVFAKQYAEVNVAQLNRFEDGATVDQ